MLSTSSSVERQPTPPSPCRTQRLSFPLAFRSSRCQRSGCFAAATKASIDRCGRTADEVLPIEEDSTATKILNGWALPSANATPRRILSQWSPSDHAASAGRHLPTEIAAPANLVHRELGQSYGLRRPEPSNDLTTIGRIASFAATAAGRL